MKPDKPKWAAAITKIMHEDPVEVASIFTTDSDLQFYVNDDFRLARIGGKYLLARFVDSSGESYEWIDSSEKVKKEMSAFTSEAEWQDELGSWPDPKLVDSMIDSAPLFGEEWDPDDIVREIEADENFRVRILTWDTLPDEYED